jgi:predicted nuclease of predicted toxin-antitoxin system
LRLLFDQNLSARLVSLLADIYPGSALIRLLGLREADDRATWDYAARNGLIVVSKDADFWRLSARLGAPPKVVWVRIGNAPTAEVEGALRANYAEIQRMIQDPEAGFCMIEA